MWPLKITYLTSRAQALPAAQLAIRHQRNGRDSGHHVEGPAVGVVAAWHRPVRPPAADGVDVEGPDHQPVQALGGRGEVVVAGRAGPAEAPWSLSLERTVGPESAARRRARRASRVFRLARRRAGRAASALILRIRAGPTWPAASPGAPERAIFSSRACWAAARAAWIASSSAARSRIRAPPPRRLLLLGRDGAAAAASAATLASTSA